MFARYTCFHQTNKKLICMNLGNVDIDDGIWNTLEEIIILANEFSDASIKHNKYANLPNTLKYLQISILNIELTNLPINLQKLKLIDPQILIKDCKIPFGCKVTLEFILDKSSEIGKANKKYFKKIDL